jgi:hypothetical protein
MEWHDALFLKHILTGVPKYVTGQEAETHKQKCRNMLGHLVQVGYICQHFK